MPKVRASSGRPAHAPVPEPHAHGEARDHPDAVVRRILVAPRPRGVHRQEALVVDARLDGAPTDGLAIEERDEPRGGGGLGLVAVRLLAQPSLALLFRKVPPVRVVDLEPLALTAVRVAALTEHSLNVLPQHAVCGDDGVDRFD